MYRFFELIFYIEFFLVPISVGFFTHALIKGKNKKPYLLAVISTTTMFILSFIGIYINGTQEKRDEIKAGFVQMLQLDQIDLDE